MRGVVLTDVVLTGFDRPTDMPSQK